MKDIRGFEGLYAITKDGKIWNYPKQWIAGKGALRQHGGEWSSYYKDPRGYLQLNLCKEGKSYHFKVHRLIALTFIPNPENKPQVNHIDGNKSNNDISNLEWVTASEDAQHAYDIGLYSNRKAKEFK